MTRWQVGLICPCNSKKIFAECCGTFISGDCLPETAEALMRSRYSAFETGAIDYLIRTTHHNYLKAGDGAQIAAWMLEVRSWDKLEILDARENTVEFVAHYQDFDGHKLLHERSRFSRFNGAWVYETGH